MNVKQNSYFILNSTADNNNDDADCSDEDDKDFGTSSCYHGMLR